MPDHDILNDIPSTSTTSDDILYNDRRRYAFNPTTVTPSTRQRLSAPTAGPKDIPERVSKIEIVLDNGLCKMDTNAAEIRNLQNDIARHERAISLLHSHGKSTTRTMESIRQKLVEFSAELKDNGANIHEVLKHRLPSILKDIDKLMDQLTHQGSTIDKYQGTTEETIREMHTLLDDVHGSVYRYQSTLSDHAGSIEDLSKQVGNIIELIKSWSLTKKIVIRITSGVVAAVSVLFTLYMSGAIGAIARLIVKLAGSE